VKYEIALVGGGLQNALIALAVLGRRPETRIAMLERDSALGGNHLWSFHGDDVPRAARSFVEPLVTSRWAGWDVTFPELERAFEIPYASVSSARLHATVTETFARSVGAELFTNTPVASVSEHEVVLGDGRIVRAGLVVDARGPERSMFPSCGFQTFVGLELSLRRPSPVTRPVLMDATVEQTGGYRFLYILPFAQDRVMIEDTYFADSCALDHERVRGEILAHAARLGFDVAAIVREERGALPLPLRMDFSPPSHGPLVAGYRGGWFHPTTGYSFPSAVRLALHIAETFPNNVFGPEFRALCDGHARQLRFALLLNRLLFCATPSEHRRDVMERFHRLPEATVRRFYAMTTTAADRARIICGRPPRGVSLRAALAEVMSA
jgi:lycopene beta-cyclase